MHKLASGASRVIALMVESGIPGCRAAVIASLRRPTAACSAADTSVSVRDASVAVAMAVGVLGVLGMLIVDHGPWNKPKVQPAFVASYSSTGEAARAAGAKVMPTEPKLQVEPEPPMPKPVHPVNPATQ